MLLLFLALEFYNGRLYGAFHESGPEVDDGVLGTINMATGVITEIGTLTGMDTPTGGLHVLDGTMYAVGAADTNYSSLFTVNPATGATTEVAPITLDAEFVYSATALAFGDGKMYLLLNRNTNLYSIDLLTAELTLEFDTGIGLNSLTSASSGSVASTPVPTFSPIAMIILAGLLLFLVRRKLIA